MEPRAEPGRGVTACEQDLARVRACLDTVIDPCSEVAGHPAVLVTMGLVRRLEVETAPEGLTVTARIGVTEPGCLMGVAFVRDARERLAALPGVARVDVAMEYACDWEPADMDPVYRQRRQLTLTRAGRALRLPLLDAGPAGSR